MRRCLSCTCPPRTRSSRPTLSCWRWAWESVRLDWGVCWFYWVLREKTPHMPSDSGQREVGALCSTAMLALGAGGWAPLTSIGCGLPNRCVASCRPACDVPGNGQ